MTSARRTSLAWITFGLFWFGLCAAALRPDRPASLLVHYCADSGNLPSCEQRPDDGVLIPPPNIAVAERDLLFFAFIGLGPPLLVLAMGWAARWAASGGDAEGQG
jgi:hypothetical protein